VQKGRSRSPGDLIVDDDRVVTANAPAESTHLGNVHRVLGVVSRPGPVQASAMVRISANRWKALLRAAGVDERGSGEDPLPRLSNFGILIGP
jgi:hypothetical protein